ncbi:MULTISPECIES: saccharopine dehydrogenase family protein [Sorangium]|uniref:Saccharopine dehydrogenase n=1 Tax=Sorangium cellulosum TaxID=56 RepID=A0A150QUC9_SORCE|nr:saccharopine dehydrogenase NADP-binding domain-containing protein [Sorangium cellulosum]KYF71581.1 saccharopine dehydrogenase [Sorangium cellulosum]
MSSSDRTYDVIVFGATGFTGRLVAEYLATKGKDSSAGEAAARPVRWAIAGRNAGRLAEVKAAMEAIDPACSEVGVIEATSEDAASLERMASQARVVLTTVGPYSTRGEPLVEACIRAGTDYADLTGEPEFVDRLLDRHHEAARARGVRIVNCCGFDSIPHDLGVLFTVTKLPAGEPIVVEGVVRAHGSFSGGTWQSLIEIVAQTRRRKREAGKEQEHGPRKVRGLKARIRYEKGLRAWVSPMPSIDPQVVLRSARELDVYGPDFQYGHYMQVKSGLQLVIGIAGLGAVAALAKVGPTRELLRKVRSPGEGPSAEERARSWFQVTFEGKSASRKVVTRVSGGDPGYSETAKMVAESALCMAFDRERLPARAGVLTPAVAMGERLIERLQAAGIRFELLEG